MKVRVVSKGDDLFWVLAEVGTSKGKKVLSGEKVGREWLRQETRRLVRQARGEVGTELE